MFYRKVLMHLNLLFSPSSCVVACVLLCIYCRHVTFGFPPQSKHMQVTLTGSLRAWMVVCLSVSTLRQTGSSLSVVVRQNKPPPCTNTELRSQTVAALCLHRPAGRPGVFAASLSPNIQHQTHGVGGGAVKHVSKRRFPASDRS